MEVLCLCEQASTVSLHFFLLELAISDLIWMSSALMSGCVGSIVRSESRCRMSCLVESGRFGIQFGIWPCGMLRLDARRRIRRNWISPALQEEGCSVILEYESLK